MKELVQGGIAWLVAATAILFVRKFFTLEWQPERYRYETVRDWKGEEIEKVVDLEEDSG